MIVNFDALKGAALSKKKQEETRYIITIGSDEEPAFAVAELQKGVVTVMITARTPEEAVQLGKRSEAARRVVHN